MLFFLIVLFAFCTAFVLMPLVIALSWWIGAVDVPCDWRRMHRTAVPRAGGLAIFLAFFLGLILLGAHERFYKVLLCGGGLMLLLGLADDLFCLSAGSKLLFQVSITTAAVLGASAKLDVGTLGAVIWVLFLINAHNFIDGLDGLFAGVATIETIFLALAFLLSGIFQWGMPTLVLGASCLGFRMFNRFPAQCFAGDCGSETVGFLLGMLSLPLLSLDSPVHGICAPLLIFAYPLTDLGTAVIRRILKGKNPFLADRGHLHHRICAAGATQVQCVGVLEVISAVLGAVGAICTASGLEMLASGICLLAVVILMKIRRFIVDFA